MPDNAPILGRYNYFHSSFVAVIVATEGAYYAQSSCFGLSTSLAPHSRAEPAQRPVFSRAKSPASSYDPAALPRVGAGQDF